MSDGSAIDVFNLIGITSSESLRRTDPGGFIWDIHNFTKFWASRVSWTACCIPAIVWSLIAIKRSPGWILPSRSAGPSGMTVLTKIPRSIFSEVSPPTMVIPIPNWGSFSRTTSNMLMSCFSGERSSLLNLCCSVAEKNVSFIIYLIIYRSNYAWNICRWTLSNQ